MPDANRAKWQNRDIRWPVQLGYPPSLLSASLVIAKPLPLRLGLA